MVNEPVVTIGFVVESITPEPPIIGFADVPTTIPLEVTTGYWLIAIEPANVTVFVVIFVLVPVKTVGAAGGGGV